MDQLDTALAQHAPPPIPDDPTLYELPPLILDGIPTPVEKMTQAQLRAFIPLMLKYSTGKIYKLIRILTEVHFGDNKIKYFSGNSIIISYHKHVFNSMSIHC